MALPGFTSGMRYKMLSLDVDSGGCSMTVQLDGGYQRPAGFSWSEMEMIVIGGELQVGDGICCEGHYFLCTCRLRSAGDEYCPGLSGTDDV